MSVMIKVMYCLLIIIAVHTTHIFGLVKFTIPKTDVVHPKTGLILHYRTEYRPANKIVTFTVSLPMYSDMCFLIPNEAMGKIPDCEDKEATVRVIRETQQKLQRNSQDGIQPVERQESTIGILGNGSSTPKPTKKSKKAANPTTKSISTVNPTTKSKSTMNPTTKPTSTANPTTKLMSTLSTSTSAWQRMKELLNENNGAFHIVKENGTLIVNYTATRPNPSLLKPNGRSKRIIPAIIAIGVGIASTVLSATNIYQISNLKSEIRGVKETLGAIQLATVNNEAQILHLNEGQLKLAKELGDTQAALNRTMALVNQHSKILNNHAVALKTILSQTLFLRNQLDTVTHALNTHFIHESIEGIMSNKLNLLFVHHTDMNRVVKMVTQAMNLTTNEFNSSIPLVEMITRLLVRQQIDFAPLGANTASDDGVLIGKMIFTSFFAAPAPDQKPFSIYEVVPIPFNQGKRRVQLARMSAYLGIEPESQEFIRWPKEEAMMCDFEVMPACRETPARCIEEEDDCIYQILTESKLKIVALNHFPKRYLFAELDNTGQYQRMSVQNVMQYQMNKSMNMYWLIMNKLQYPK